MSYPKGPPPPSAQDHDDLIEQAKSSYMTAQNQIQGLAQFAETVRRSNTSLFSTIGTLESHTKPLEEEHAAPPVANNGSRAKEPVAWSMAAGVAVNAGIQVYTLLTGNTIDPVLSGSISTVIMAAAGLVARQFVTPVK
jgi:hypothetical protein